MTLHNKELILGVTGSIAAYKAVYLLRELTRLGARVTVVTTAHADRFIGPLTFRTLSGRPVLSDLFDPQSPEAVEHVALAERAHALVVAPATANLLARAAHGLADDFLTTLLLAARCPVLMAPAMDGGMWDHAAVSANVRTLRERGVTVLEPDAGALASGLSGRGRLPEVDAIVEALERHQDQVEEGRGARARPGGEPGHPPRAGRSQGPGLPGGLRGRDQRRARQRGGQARGQGRRSPRRQRRERAGHRLRGRRQPGDAVGSLGRRGRPSPDEQARGGRRHPRPGARPARGAARRDARPHRALAG